MLVSGTLYSAVIENDEYQFQMDLPPMRTSRIVKALSVVVHYTSTSAIMRDQVMEIFVRCENTTAVHHIRSYTVSDTDKLKEWLELSINTTSIPCTASEQCSFLAQITGESSSLDTFLVVYDYSQYGGLEGGAHATVQKRTADGIANKTLLSDYQTSEINCSVHSIFLNYATELRIYGTQQVIYPSRVGINMTYCYGSCIPEYLTPPVNISSAERIHFLHHLLKDINIPIQGACCVPDVMENDNLLIANPNGEVIELQTFPQVVTCKCII